MCGRLSLRHHTATPRCDTTSPTHWWCRAMDSVGSPPRYFHLHCRGWVQHGRGKKASGGLWRWQAGEWLRLSLLWSTEQGLPFLHLEDELRVTKAKPMWVRRGRVGLNHPFAEDRWPPQCKYRFFLTKIFIYQIVGCLFRAQGLFSGALVRPLEFARGRPWRLRTYMKRCLPNLTSTTSGKEMQQQCDAHPNRCVDSLEELPKRRDGEYSLLR